MEAVARVPSTFAATGASARPAARHGARLAAPQASACGRARCARLSSSTGRPGKQLLHVSGAACRAASIDLDALMPDAIDGDLRSLHEEAGAPASLPRSLPGARHHRPSRAPPCPLASPLSPPHHRRRPRRPRRPAHLPQRRRRPRGPQPGRRRLRPHPLGAFAAALLFPPSRPPPPRPAPALGPCLDMTEPCTNPLSTGARPRRRARPPRVAGAGGGGPGAPLPRRRPRGGGAPRGPPGADGRTDGLPKRCAELPLRPHPPPPTRGSSSLVITEHRTMKMCSLLGDSEPHNARAPASAPRSGEVRRRRAGHRD